MFHPGLLGLSSAHPCTVPRAAAPCEVNRKFTHDGYGNPLTLARNDLMNAGVPLLHTGSDARATSQGPRNHLAWANAKVLEWLATYPSASPNEAWPPNNVPFGPTGLVV